MFEGYIVLLVTVKAFRSIWRSLQPLLATCCSPFFEFQPVLQDGQRAIIWTFYFSLSKEVSTFDCGTTELQWHTYLGKERKCLNTDEGPSFSLLHITKKFEALSFKGASPYWLASFQKVKTDLWLKFNQHILEAIYEQRQLAVSKDGKILTGFRRTRSKCFIYSWTMFISTLSFHLLNLLFNCK